MNYIAISKAALIALSASTMVGCVAETQDPTALEEDAAQVEDGPVGSVSQALSGAYVSNVVGSTIYSKNLWYYSDFPILGSPGSSTITTISWGYGLSYYPTGFIAYLCHNTAGCYDVTYFRSGSTNAFQGYPANQPFYLAYGVPGTTTMQPAYGQSDQIIVNYQ